ncbi:glycoside hydrolase family 97 N-terminal domain-containing protein [bacterium]|nr:glycoside hydrolase family 97 N-terminal domain-containing protein [bacterium]
MKRILLTVLFVATLAARLPAQQIGAVSPDGTVRVKITIDSAISYAVSMGDRMVLAPSQLSLTVNGTELGRNPRLISDSGSIVSEVLSPVIRQKSAQIENTYTLLTLEFEKRFSVLFRIYNDGVAYRFVTSGKGEAVVNGETAAFRFPGDPMVWFPEENSFFTHQEREYKHIRLSEITPDRRCIVPALVEVENGPFVLLTEADLDDYPGMSLAGNGGGNGFQADFPHYALADTMTRDRDVPVTKTADYLAKTDGKRSFPWRVMIISEDAAGLVESQMIYRLAQPLQLKDTEWIRPGKVA